MEYNFSSLCSDQIERLLKKLEASNKSFISEYKMALNVINSHNLNSRWDEVMEEVHCLMDAQVKHWEATYTETLNKVQRALTKYL
jgi:hypothetical protein